MKITKSYYFEQFRAFYSQLQVYIQWFGTSDDLVIARGALWDIRYFSSTNNLRFVKKFLEIIWESLIAKNWKSQNHSIYQILSILMEIVGVYSMILDFWWFGNSTSCSAGSQIFCPRQNFWDLLKFFLRSSASLSIAKKWKSQNHRIFAASMYMQKLTKNFLK